MGLKAKPKERWLKWKENFWKKMSEYRLVPWVVGQSCCSIELESVSDASYAWERLGLCQKARHPAEANLLIVSGWLNELMVQEIKNSYDVMLEPKYVIAVGACAISGSPFKLGSENTVALKNIVPVDVFVPGCPPRPETLMDAVIQVRKLARPFNDDSKVIYDALRPSSRTN